MSIALFHKVVLPVVPGCDNQPALQVARMLARSKDILVLGLVQVREGESLSMGALPARELRKTIREWKARDKIRSEDRIRVTNHAWEELENVLRDEEPELLVVTAEQFSGLGMPMSEALKNLPCSVAVLSGDLPDAIQQVLIAVRGGPSSELALRIGLSFRRSGNIEMNALHLMPPGTDAERDLPFRGIERVLKNLPEVQIQEKITEDPADAILSAAANSDLLIMGATVQAADQPVGIGPIAEMILNTRSKATLLVKVPSSVVGELDQERAGLKAISVLVDKWFAESTYHSEEFSDLQALLRRKQEQKLTVSLALPALNEEETVGTVIRTIKSELMERVPLLDEIVLMDSDSTDGTREIATELGVPVYIHQEILPQYGARRGKGEALWKSLYVTHGDIVLWIDTDIVNIQPYFVYGLLGPLLLNPEALFVKGYYQRPLKVDGKMQAGGGGRVTELAARPLLNLFYPELSGVIQPLSGEYGGRRSALEGLPFSSGYGVEIGLLIDIFEKYGLKALTQVDLSERIHHNQPLDSLSKMSFAIIQTVVRRLESRYGRNIIDDINKTMKLIRYEQGNLFLEVNEIAEVERPPMLEVEEYRERFRVGAR